MKHANYRTVRWRQVSHRYYSFVRKHLYYKECYLHSLTEHFNFLKRIFYRHSNWLDCNFTFNAGKPTERYQPILSYSYKSWYKRSKQLTKAKRAASRYTRRKVKQMLHIGEDPMDKQWSINPWIIT